MGPFWGWPMSPIAVGMAVAPKHPLINAHRTPSPHRRTSFTPRPRLDEVQEDSSWKGAKPRARKSFVLWAFVERTSQRCRPTPAHLHAHLPLCRRTSRHLQDRSSSSSPRDLVQEEEEAEPRLSEQTKSCGQMQTDVSSHLSPPARPIVVLLLLATSSRRRRQRPRLSEQTSPAADRHTPRASHLSPPARPRRRPDSQSRQAHTPSCSSPLMSSHLATCKTCKPRRPPRDLVQETARLSADQPSCRHAARLPRLQRGPGASRGSLAFRERVGPPGPLNPPVTAAPRRRRRPAAPGRGARRHLLLPPDALRGGPGAARQREGRARGGEPGAEEACAPSSAPTPARGARSPLRLAL